MAPVTSSQPVLQNQTRRLHIPLLVLAVLSAAFLYSSKWTILNATSGVTAGMNIFISLVGSATLITCALIFRNRLPRTEVLAILVLIFSAMHLVGLYLSTLVIPDATLNQLVIGATGALYGIAFGLFYLIIGQMFSCFPPRTSAVLFASTHLVTNCIMLIIPQFDEPGFLMIRSALTLAGSVGLLASILLLKREGLVAVDTAARETPAASFPAGRFDWVSFLLAVAVIEGLFGLIAQASSNAGSSFGLYDEYTSVAIVIFDVLVVSLLAFWGERLNFPFIVILVTLLYSVGFATYSYAWQLNIPLAGIMVRCGFETSCILFAALLAKTSYANPRHTYFYFGMYNFVGTTLTYLGRSAGLALTENQVLGDNLMDVLSQVSLWSICLLAIMLLTITYIRQSSAAEENSTGRPAESQPTTSDTPAYPAASSAEAAKPGSGNDSAKTASSPDTVNVEELIAHDLQLTPREAEVLHELVRGQSRAGIAGKLYLSPETVKNYITRIYLKAGVSSKQELLDYLDEHYPKI